MSPLVPTFVPDISLYVMLAALQVRDLLDSNYCYPYALFLTTTRSASLRR